MAIHSIGRKRVRSKRNEPIPMEVATTPPTPIDELIGGVACCVPVTIGHFKNEAMVAVYRRHVGRRCAPQMETMDIREWRHGKASQ